MLTLKKKGGLLAACLGLTSLGVTGQIGTASFAQAATKPASLSVLMGYIPDMEDYGFEYGLHKGYDSAENLQVKLIPAGNGVNAIQEVEAGAAQVGITDASDIIAAVGNGAKLEVFGAEFQTSPTSLTCRQDSGVKTISEIKGKSIGVKQGASTLFNFFLQANHIAASEVKEVPIGASDISEIIAGQVQCEFTTFSFNEPKEIEDQGVKVRVFPLSQYGVPDVADAFFTTKAFYDKPGTKQILVRFLKASGKAWATQFKNPTAAATWEVGQHFVDGLDLSQQKYQAKEQTIYMSGPLTKKDGLFATSPALWKMTAKAAFEQKVTKSVVNTAPWVTNSLVIQAQTPKL